MQDQPSLPTNPEPNPSPSPQVPQDWLRGSARLQPRRRFWSLHRRLLLTIALSLSALAGILFGSLIIFLSEIPLVSDLKAYHPSQATKIFDAHGKAITELFSEQRTLISLKSVPLPLQQAVIAIEDNNFYQHFGIQMTGIIRSLMVNVLHKSYQQGGSTITQQLARNMFLTRRKTIERKIKEVILALQIERMYTKPEILEMYLNQIYFGNGAYGVESASRTYFGKHVQELDLAECALLAGLPRAPNTYNPYRNGERSTLRRNLVLAQMQRLGYISATESAQAKAEPIKLGSIEVSQAPYFVEYVRRQLEDRYGSNAVYKGGLKIYTSLDLAVQEAAQDTMNQGLVDAERLITPNLPHSAGRPPEALQCALVVLDPSNGQIKAMIGGRNFTESKFNRAVQAQRQPGSAFKPFIYTAAFNQGFTQADIILDAPMVVKGDKGQVWKPENFSNKFGGPTTLRAALTHSRNIVTIKLLEKIGVNSAIDMAHRMGIASPLNPYLTLALGASEVNLLELTSAYGCFPNRGIRVEPVSVLRVEDAESNVLEENGPVQQEVLEENTAYIMTDVLKNVINSGTGYPVRRLGFSYPAAGKTGTTNDFTDAWFIGFTSEYVAGVWLGLDSHRSLGRGITGGMVSAPIWANLMLRIYGRHAPKDFEKPDSVNLASFCKASGLLPNPECGQANVMEGAFALGTEPTKHCDVHGAGLGGLQPGYNLNASPDLLESPGGAKAGSPGGSFDGEAGGEAPEDDNPDAAPAQKPGQAGPVQHPVNRHVPPML